MKQNKFGELVFSDQDLFNLLMSGQQFKEFKHMIVDHSVDVSQLPAHLLIDLPRFDSVTDDSKDVQQFHQQMQSNWHMPDEYKNLDIAAHVLNLCNNQAELQRCGHELLLFQERNLFDVLRYLKYLVDIMKTNNIIWGVGRGSSVASYVLYKLGVHRIDSLYYDLDPEEFLR